MKQNKKGFTLIELLAVIVILAIIALIATPIVLNMINSAKKSAAKSSALGYIDSIEYYAGFAQANSTDMDLGDYSASLIEALTFTGGVATCSKTDSGWSSDACTALMNAVDTKSKGQGPKTATIKINEAGKVQDNSTLTYAGGTCTYTNNDCTMSN